MKHNLKSDIRSLLYGDKEKTEILVVNNNCKPGYYWYDGKMISASQLEDLKKGYNHTIVFSLAKGKKYQDSTPQGE